jgi:hypothetical protein
VCTTAMTAHKGQQGQRILVEILANERILQMISDMKGACGPVTMGGVNTIYIELHIYIQLYINI